MIQWGKCKTKNSSLQYPKKLKTSSLNELSEIILKAVANRPDLLTMIQPDGGTGKAPVQAIRKTITRRKADARMMFNRLHQKQVSIFGKNL